jgi:hypothetical protein
MIGLFQAWRDGAASAHLIGNITRPDHAWLTLLASTRWILKSDPEMSYVHCNTSANMMLGRESEFMGH